MAQTHTEAEILVRRNAAVIILAYECEESYTDVACALSLSMKPLHRTTCCSRQRTAQINNMLDVPTADAAAAVARCFLYWNSLIKCPADV